LDQMVKFMMVVTRLVSFIIPVLFSYL